MCPDTEEEAEEEKSDEESAAGESIVTKQKIYSFRQKTEMS